MVCRLEKTDRSDMFIGHDWILRMSENGELGFLAKLQYVVMRQSRAVHIPVISLTVLKIFSFSGSSDGTLL